MRRMSSLWLPFAAAALIAGCTAEVEDSGSLPDVDVSGGEAPDINVEPAEVNISTDTQTVVTPEVTVTPR